MLRPLTVGAGTSCALTSAGQAKCWGGPYVGDGTVGTRLTATSVLGLTSQKDVIATSTAACALGHSGVASCWGNYFGGSVGNGTTALGGAPSPVAVIGLPANVIELVNGARFGTGALTTTGGIYCWGPAFGSTATPIVGMTNVRAIALGNTQLYALTTTGGVLRQNVATKVIDTISGLSAVTQVVAGYDHACALTAAGGVKCWGSNPSGQLGDGTTTPRAAPADVLGLHSGVRALAAGWFHTCAVMTSGTVKCWGENGAGNGPGGRLGDGTTTSRSSPVDVGGLTDAVLVAAGTHTCALTTTGKVKCWGAMYSGDGTAVLHLTPVTVVGF